MLNAYYVKSNTASLLVVSGKETLNVAMRKILQNEVNRDAKADIMHIP